MARGYLFPQKQIDAARGYPFLQKSKRGMLIEVTSLIGTELEVTFHSRVGQRVTLGPGPGHRSSS